MAQKQTTIGSSTFIGEQLRSLREERGISLRELADRSGVSASQISQLERDLTNPTVDTLYRISSGLGVSVFALLNEPASQAQVVRAERRRRITISDGELHYELLSPSTHGMLEVWMGRLAANAAMSDEPSTHASEEFILVLEGRMRIVIGEDEHTLEEGDSIQYDGNRPHRISSVGDNDLRFLSALTPPTL